MRSVTAAAAAENPRTVFRPPVPTTGKGWGALREASGLSVRQLARRAGVSEPTLWKLEHDRAVGEATKRLVWFALGLGVLPEQEPLWREESA